MMAREVRSKDELLVLLRSRVRALGGTYEQVDEVAQFPERYCSKLLGPSPSRNMAASSLFKIMGALGLKILVEDDEDALRLVAQNYSRKRRAS